MNTSWIAALERVGHPRVLVLGDVMLDRYTWGVAERVSPEAPVLTLRAQRSECRPGGAAAVSVLLAQLGAEALSSGVVGEDPHAHALQRLLQSHAVCPAGVISDPARPTTVKERFFGSGVAGGTQNLLRVDQESREPLPPEIERRLCRQAVRSLRSCAALILSDYGKGVCTPAVLRATISTARRASIPVIVDPAYGVAPGRYEGASLLVPNRRKFEQYSGTKVDRPQDAAPGARELCRQLGLQAVLVTLDRDGMVLVPAEGPLTTIPARAHSLVDVTGASDMVMAVLGTCLAAGIEIPLAAQLAAVAAGLEVQRFGVSPIRREEILEAIRPPHGSTAKIVTLDQLVQRLQVQRAQGCFDLLHAGHVTHLEEAAAAADLLVVAINSDASVRKLKGKDRPVVSEGDRARMLAAMQCVDFVVVFDEDTPHQLLRRIRPDVLAKGGDYQIEDVVGREIVEQYGGRVQVTGMVFGRSTTLTIHTVHQQQRSPDDGRPHAVSAAS